MHDMDEAYALMAKNLRHYRIMNGLRQAEVADRMGVKLQRYEKAENGKVRPEDSFIRAFCKAMNVRMGNLLEPVELPQCAHLRRNYRNQSEAEKAIETRRVVLRKAGDYRFLLEAVENRTEESDRRLLETFRAEAMASGNPARYTRERFGAGGTFLPETLPEYLNRIGIVVCAFPFFDSGEGFSLPVPGIGDIVAVNLSPDIPLERKVETCAHELGHVLYGTHGTEHGSKRTGDEAEDEAAAFYRDFLLPMDEFRRTWELAGFQPFAQKILNLRNLHRVPARLVIRRAIEAGYCDGNAYGRFGTMMKRYGCRVQAGEFAPMPGEMTPPPYARRAVDALRADKITMSKFSEITGVKISRVQELVAIP